MSISTENDGFIKTLMKLRVKIQAGKFVFKVAFLICKQFDVVTS
jgi:hypothetical protein